LLLLLDFLGKRFEHPDEEMNNILKDILNILVENLNNSFD